MVSELASAAGLPCSIDPVLVHVLKQQKAGKYCYTIYQTGHLSHDWVVHVQTLVFLTLNW